MVDIDLVFKYGNSRGFVVSIEIDFVFVWVVENYLISEWAIDLLHKNKRGPGSKSHSTLNEHLSLSSFINVQQRFGIEIPPKS